MLSAIKYLQVVAIVRNILINAVYLRRIKFEDSAAEPGMTHGYQQFKTALFIKKGQFCFSISPFRDAIHVYVISIIFYRERSYL